MTMRHISVRRRLALLVVVEVFTVLLLVGVGAVWLHKLDSDLYYVRRWVLQPVDEIGAPLERAIGLGLALEREPIPAEQVRADAEALRSFAVRYKTVWMLAGNTSPDAARFKAQLSDQGRLGLIDEEARVVAALQGALDRLASTPPPLLAEPPAHRDAAEVLDSFGALLRWNMAFEDVATKAVGQHARQARYWLAGTGILAVLLAGLSALGVQKAIAPRIARLVTKVRRFQERGVNERMLDEGRDEIAILSNALDAGFASIATRNQAREQFLAVAAHELKTPVTSIMGFAQAALAHPENEAVRTRGLAVIAQQSARLSRLIDDLLLAARARLDEKKFQPQPTDIVALVQSVGGEVEASMAGRRLIRYELPLAAPLLADPALLSHALWSLITYAAVISSDAEPILVRVAAALPCHRVEVCAHGPMLSAEDIDHACSPFGTVSYEGGPGVHIGVGLFFCREIARVHGGLLRIGEGRVGPAFTLEVPSLRGDDARHRAGGR
jgi:signal transduction histidine kinase